ncbi:double substrate-specificity short chain dehydrogenase reductase 2 [Fusarium beomiforme]|uniref:Double substrate-specificity short chain dehydrogenase reductase 2 n=1 Tax=Fusarium beomiforme TaxID=44412 RepID=A0A9P5DTE3_9HYPO|nr:double substrate-specificity short chain dehydrogenase reductase 2 [Fusarium beomiforme]
MASTTHSEFGAHTEAVEVAKAFSDRIQGKTILITGVNRGGIGFATAHAFVTHIILAGRSPSKANESIDELKTEFPNVDYRFLEVDLSSQDSVRNAANEVLSWSNIPMIDLIINSAGIMAVQERTLSKDGIELHLATNHIGHWLLSCLIMPTLIKAASGKPKGSVRIVNVTSKSPTVSSMRWSDMNFNKKNKDLPQEEQPNYELFKLWGYKNSEETAYVPLDGYNRSKVANVLFGIEANKRLFEKYGILTLACHPGVIMTTELARNFPKETLGAVKELGSTGFYTHKSLGAGASTSLVAALDPKLANGVGETCDGSENYGSFLADCQISTEAKPLAVSSSEAEKLWKFSEKVTGETFSWLKSFFFRTNCITLAITGIRAWVRRGLAGDPKVVSSPTLRERHELAWLTLLLMGKEKDDTDSPRYGSLIEQFMNFCEKHHIPGPWHLRHRNSKNIARDILGEIPWDLITLTLSFDVVSARYPAGGLSNVLTKPPQFHLRSPPESRRSPTESAGPPLWELDDAGNLEALLSISLLSMLAPDSQTWRTRTSHAPWRVIGHNTTAEAEEKIAQFKKWLTYPANQAELNIADLVVESGLASSVEEANLLIIPAFLHDDILEES